MFITNDFTDEYSLQSYLRDVVEGIAPFKVRTSRPGHKRVRTRYIQPRELQEAFYGLIADWRQSGPDLNKFFEKRPELAVRMRHGQTTLFVALDGSGHITWTPSTSPIPVQGEEPKSYTEEEQALKLFIHFITSPIQDSLAGPCAYEKCNRLFFKTSKHTKKYCSKRCSAAVTAVPSIKQKRLEIRREKIALAQEAIEKWQAQTRLKRDWKVWVQRHTSTQKRIELRLTVQWLTRAITNRYLSVPSTEDPLIRAAQMN